MMIREFFNDTHTSTHCSVMRSRQCYSRNKQLQVHLGVLKKRGRSNSESADLVAGAGQLNSLVQFRKQYITRHPEPCPAKSKDWFRI